jgi:hypothetical protein
VLGFPCLSQPRLWRRGSSWSIGVQGISVVRTVVATNDQSLEVELNVGRTP